MKNKHQILGLLALAPGIVLAGCATVEKELPPPPPFRGGAGGFSTVFS